jgi:uncharacterized protein YpuA (DUF1002 family)
MRRILGLIAVLALVVAFAMPVATADAMSHGKKDATEKTMDKAKDETEKTMDKAKDEGDKTMDKMKPAHPCNPCAPKK